MIISYLLTVASLLCLTGSVFGNPLTDCYLKLQSETLCYDTQCRNLCNGIAGLSCDAYCKQFSTSTRVFEIGECTSLASASKSVCKCYERSSYGGKSPPRGPGGLAGAACGTAYLGQLFRGALKTVLIPG